MCCCAHILNLIVKDGMDMVKTKIPPIRNAISYLFRSPSRMQLFKKCDVKRGLFQKKTLCLDCQHQVELHLLMLELAVVFQRAFERLEDEDRVFPPSEERKQMGRTSNIG